MGLAPRGGWGLFRNHWLVSIEIGLLMLGFNMLLGFLAIFGLYVFFLPAIFVGVFAFAANNMMLLVLVFTLALFLLIFFVIAIGTIFNVFTTTLWTYLFMKMHKKGLNAHIHRLIKKFV